MEYGMERAKNRVQETLHFIKWVVYAAVVGFVVGGVAAAFHHGIDWAVELRHAHSWIIWLLPLGGVAIVMLYRVCGMEKDRGTNLVLVAVREAEPMKLRTAPLIFVSTILTHLVGGSAGREGAALQLGGSLGAYMGRTIGLDEKDRRVMVMCGMAAAFSGLFGTPLTASIFAMEVVSVGMMHYAAMVPCLVSAMVALRVTKWCGLHAHDGYDITGQLPISLDSMLQVVLLGALCAAVSVLFCKMMHLSHKVYGKYLKDPVVRAAVGGVLVLVLTLIVGSQDYNGAGDPLIRRMLGGEDIPAAFLLKILFTAVTLGAGFRGGEIVPILCTGAAFGTLLGPVLGLEQSFGGALGMAAVFCGGTNAPISSILLAYELFGGEALPLYALCCGVSYALSGYHGLYSEQKIVYSKYKVERIDKKTR